jgi:D-amino-acid oxidase
METIDTLIASAGVISLACAVALTRASCEVVVVESEPLYESGISARNSAVIHSGVYCMPGSHKARLCAIRARRRRGATRRSPRSGQD